MKLLHFLGIGRLPKRPMIDATGGTERTALEVARIQVRRGHDVTVASKADRDWEGSWEGVRLLHLKPSYSLIEFCSRGKASGSHLRVAALVHSGRFDLIHLHEYLNTKYFAGRPKVMHFHNNSSGRGYRRVHRGGAGILGTGRQERSANRRQRICRRPLAPGSRLCRVECFARKYSQSAGWNRVQGIGSAETKK